MFSRLSSYGYMYASASGSVITISVAFLGLKWFVFHTRGNYLREWIRCFGVYGTSAGIGFISLPILVTVLRPHLRHPQQAPYIAAALMTAVTVVFSFFGHKRFSFQTAFSQKDFDNQPDRIC
jgi:putative flippase GtrA